MTSQELEDEKLAVRLFKNTVAYDSSRIASPHQVEVEEWGTIFAMNPFTREYQPFPRITRPYNWNVYADGSYIDIIHKDCGKVAFKYLRRKFATVFEVKSKWALHADSTPVKRGSVLCCDGCGAVLSYKNTSNLKPRPTNVR